MVAWAGRLRQERRLAEKKESGHSDQCLWRESPIAEHTPASSAPLRRNRPLQGFIAGFFVSQLGDQVYGLALPWMVYNLTGSALAMGSLFAIGQLPILLNPFLGVLVDRFDRRRLLLTADLVRAVLVALVPLLWYTHALRLWHLYVLEMVLMTFGQMYNVTTFAMTPRVVPQSDVPLLNGIFQSMWSVGGTIGPALSGAVLAAIGAPLALLFDAVSFLATALSLVWFRPGRAPAGPAHSHQAGLLAQTWVGMRYYFTHRTLLPLGLFMLMGNLGFSLALSQVLFHYRHDLQLTAPLIGLLFSAFGLAATLSALVGPWLMQRFPWPALLIVSRIVPGLGASAHAFARAPAGLVASIPVAGLDMSGTVSATIRQRVIPPEMLGRVQATHTLVCFGANPLAGLIGGVIAQFWGATAAIVAGGLVVVVSALVVAFPGLHRAKFEVPAAAVQ